jgi:hypothetical protein
MNQAVNVLVRNWPLKVVWLAVGFCAVPFGSPWFIGTVIAGSWLVSWPDVRRSDRRSWLHRKDGRIHAIDYVAAAIVTTLITVAVVQALQPFDVECWVRTGHLRATNCTPPGLH